ncbi:MAG: helix-turn-helix domain-containing protein [Parvularcula sp.]|jgi:putative transposase|nr:helix-turn-helix domain-containing protein [Parvularcula sp.]
MSDNSLRDKAWEVAEHRVAVLASLPERLGAEDIAQAMRQLDVSRSTLFRWIKRFREEGRTSTMLPSSRGPRPGMQPLDPAVEEIVARHFKDFYAARRKPTKTQFWREVSADCRAKGFPPPSIRRLGRWLDLKDQLKLVAQREGKDKAERCYLATPGSLTAS